MESDIRVTNLKNCKQILKTYYTPMHSELSRISEHVYSLDNKN